MLNPDTLADLKARFAEVNRLMAQPEVATDPKQLAELGRELSDLRDIVTAIDVYEGLQQEQADLREMAQGDGELAEMAAMELEEVEPKLPDAEEHLRQLLIPKDPADAKDAIVEIRAGTGGDEAALFAGDLFKVYEKYAESHGWRIELMDATAGTQGGFKELIFTVRGAQAFGLLKFESGVHRVQRVPATESQGRIHTSAATVAVLPEAEDVDVEIHNNDLRIDFYRSSGPGGQSVNTTDSAVRITHIPTGVVVSIQDEKSQHKNKDKAMRVLRSRVYQMEREKAEAERAAARREMVGSGDRSAKIRTYNWPQGRVTDHRLEGDNKNHALQNILGGALDPIIEALRLEEQAERMREQAEG
ncbi:MAG: peptide chain release factor 1 [Bacteroidota bacterium]